MSYTVPIIVGPTGVGKTDLSLMVAEKLPVEIVSADSRQIYRHLSIGTDKIADAIRKKILHHMIDICNPDEYFSAGMYSRIARKVIGEIQQRGKLPLVVGGSGFYISALVDGIFELDVHDNQVRAGLHERLRREGQEALYAELKKCDAEYAVKISHSDKQRTMRALEIYIVTGRSFSSWHERDTEPAPFKPLMIGLTMERQILYERIEKRVEKMLEAGLMDEVQKLIHMGYRPGMNALNTVGYKEAFQYLQGELTFDEMVDLIKRNSRRYAKRQLTWFRRDTRIRWIEASRRTVLRRAANEIIKELSKAGQE
jgi:tRNA dimethylallyltransferase